MDIYRSKDILEKLGISKIQLSHWINKGAIIPYREDFRRGGSHEFNKQNLIEAAICKELSDLNIPVKSMVEGLKLMREYHGDLLKERNNLKDMLLVYLSPAKFNFPGMKEYISQHPGLNFENPDAPGLVKKENLLEMLEYMQGFVVINLSRVLDMVEGI
jgi:hypothetical protein